MKINIVSLTFVFSPTHNMQHGKFVLSKTNFVL